MAGLVWHVPPEEAFPEATARYALAVERMVHGVMQRYAPEVENYARDNAPWTDRTSNARQGLYTKVEYEVRRMVALELWHSMDYGIYLELANAGTYAIINPTLDAFAHRIWQEITRRL